MQNTYGIVSQGFQPQTILQKGIVGGDSILEIRLELLDRLSEKIWLFFRFENEMVSQSRGGRQFIVFLLHGEIDFLYDNPRNN